MYRVLAPVFLLAIFGLPILAVVLPPVLLSPPGLVVAGWWVASPFVYAVAFVLVAGALSRPFHRAIVPGRFPRDLSNPAYRARRLYGLCWTSVYHMTPVYFLCLSVPVLKRLLFRLFGYRGQMDFTVYPDTWIRDLPLLDFGPGAYVANKATLGTNIARADGTVLVDRVTLGARAMVGHLAMVGTGVVLEEGAEVGVGCAIGSKCTLRKGASLAPCCAIGHLCEIGEGTRIGFMSAVGNASRIGPALHSAPATVLPHRARALDQAALDRFPSSARVESPVLAEPVSASSPQPNGHVGSRPAPSPEPVAALSGSHGVPAKVPRWNAFE